MFSSAATGSSLAVWYCGAWHYTAAATTLEAATRPLYIVKPSFVQLTKKFACTNHYVTDQNSPIILDKENIQLDAYGDHSHVGIGTATITDPWFCEYLLQIGNRTEETIGHDYVQLLDDIVIGYTDTEVAVNKLI